MSRKLTVVTPILRDFVAGRTKRSLQFGIGWPPQSYENTIEVLVVVDGSMIKYHGSDVKTYVLNLIKMVNIKIQIGNPLWTFAIN